ncbi:MAG: FAD-binding and (Fe-S)-binding domain-containing protein [Rhodothermales bacterium]
MPSIPTPSAELLDDFAAGLRPRLVGDLRIDALTRVVYATDASLYQIQPLGVLIPKHVDDVQAALEGAARYQIPVLPRGGGSSLAGQTVGAALVIDFTKHLDALHEINADERWVRVQPGLVLDHLNAALAPRGLMVGPDPASSNRATLGGMVGNNSTGTHSILYGNLVRHILEIRALLADGSPVAFNALDAAAWRARTKQTGFEGLIYRGLDQLLKARGPIIERDTPKHWRRNSGYRLEYVLNENGEAGRPATTRNVAQLLCGSEGTLAVSTELTLSLVPRPKRTALGIVHFHARPEALRAVTTILETEPSAVELLDGVAIEQTRRTPGFAHRLTFVEGSPGAVLITEYYGEAERTLRSRLEDLERALDRAGQGYAVVRVVEPSQIQNVWAVRKAGLGLIMGVKGEYKPVAVIEDASVPVEHLADYIEELDRLLAETDTRAAYYAHASAGCLHVRPFLNTRDPRDVAKMREISQGSMELVARYGGSVSSEHGDGLVRGWLNERFLGPDLYQVHRELKEIFDPECILNPGKIVDTPPPGDNLRLGPAYRAMPIREMLDWSRDGSLAEAVEMCNGNGACRKLHSGVMCPSFMATREEEHSTRGRANALRAAMSGLLPPEEWTGARMYEVMDLCIQCKACKVECTSNVDMAKMKTEWLSHYQEANGPSRRARLFVYQPRLARLLSGGVKARIVNWASSLKPVRALLKQTLGISPERTVPPFAREPFTTWFAGQQWEDEGASVVLFADTFNNYQHPETARAAAEFLHRTGYRVIVPDARTCCGRPFLSKGFVTEAQERALQTVDALYPYAEQGLPIVGLEPSCILTFLDEFLTLLPGDLRARRVAEVTMTFEQYVARLADAGALADVAWTDDTRRVLLHGHCHQKALVGTGPAERCLSLPPSYTTETVDAGCCGMAGAFGYEKEHYALSIKMAEHRLAPAVRAAAEDTIIAAAGTSCRAQIRDTTGRHALHPAEVLRDALA